MRQRRDAKQSNASTAVKMHDAFDARISFSTWVRSLIADIILNTATATSLPQQREMTCRPAINNIINIVAIRLNTTFAALHRDRREMPIYSPIMPISAAENASRVNSRFD